MLNNNICRITQNSLCTGCGACSGVCPHAAISMFRNEAGFLVPNINENNCVDCGICLKICPSNNENKKLASLNWLDGSYCGGVVGYANDEEVRLCGQSGGLVTAVLQFLLEENVIDSAIVTKYDADRKESVADVITDSKELINATGSYYTQSSVAEKCFENKDSKIGVVTVGCESLALRFCAERNMIDRPEVILGLFCERQFSISMLDEFVKNRKLSYFRARDKKSGGWPGNVRAILDTGTEKVWNKKKRLDLNDYYTNYRCAICSEMNNTNADIVFGDPWCLIGEMTDNDKDFGKGYTVAVARTEKGLKILQNASEAGYITIEKMDPEKVFYENDFSYGKMERIRSALLVAEKRNLPTIYSSDDIEKIYKKEESVSYSKYYEKWMNYWYMLGQVRDKNEFVRLVKKKKGSCLISKLFEMIRAVKQIILNA